MRTCRQARPQVNPDHLGPLDLGLQLVHRLYRKIQKSEEHEGRLKRLLYMVRWGLNPMGGETGRFGDDADDRDAGHGIE
jgi:hypothetical protein